MEVFGSDPAAIHPKSIGVAEDIVGLVAEDFLATIDDRAIAADHFVEDGAGASVVDELRVGLHLQGLGGAAVDQAVVDDQPRAADVVFLILVMGKAAVVGLDDIDDRHAVGFNDVGHATDARNGSYAMAQDIGAGGKGLPQQHGGHGKAQLARRKTAGTAVEKFHGMFLLRLERVRKVDQPHVRFAAGAASTCGGIRAGQGDTFVALAGLSRRIARRPEGNGSAGQHG